MDGWKTWMAAISMVIYAVGGFIGGVHDAQTMSQLIIGAMALVGIGGKLTKIIKK